MSGSIESSAQDEIAFSFQQVTQQFDSNASPVFRELNLSIDVGQPVAPPSATQAGFVSMHGLGSQSASSKTIGLYVVSVAGQGFEDTADGNANEIDPSIRNLYRDTYYNNDDRPGFGVTLTIEGVLPNTDYDLKLWSYDAAQSFSSTPTCRSVPPS